MDDTELKPLDIIESKIDEVKAMLLEILQWKTEVEQSLEEMKGGGMLSMFSKLFAKSP